MSSEPHVNPTGSLWLLIIWSLLVALITGVGIGFAGGLRAAFVGNIAGILLAASPVVPLTIWLHDRKRARNQSGR